MKSILTIYIYIYIYIFLLCSCGFIRTVSKNHSKINSNSDSVITRNSLQTASLKKDSSTSESSTTSSKSNFNFVIDTSKKTTTVNNYVTPPASGNQGFDFMRWLVANGYLKSGSISLQEDSTYQRFNRMLLENQYLKQKNDSLASHSANEIESNSKDTSKTIQWNWWEIAFMGIVLLGLWEGIRYIKSKFKLVKIIPV